MIREIAYDEVRDSQRHFRSILDSVAYPGTIRHLDPVELTPPQGLTRSSVLVAFALLNSDVSFHLVNMDEGSAAYLSLNTRAAHLSIESATFVFADGPTSPELLDGIHCGTLLYPDTAATLVVQVSALSASPLAGGVKLMFQGPGVNETAPVFVLNLNPDLLLALQARNAEFPLGVDTFMTCDDELGRPCVLGIPRTTKVVWESC